MGNTLSFLDVAGRPRCPFVADLVVLVDVAVSFEQCGDVSQQALMLDHVDEE